MLVDTGQNGRSVEDGIDNELGLPLVPSEWD